MKSIIVFACLFVGVFASAQTVNPRGRVAQAVLAVNLNNGDAVSVRRSLVNLVQGDFVTRLEGYVKANQPGAHLDILKDNVKIWEIGLSTQMGTFSIPINLRNGVDYGSLMIVSYGCTYIDSIEAYIAGSSQDEPIPHNPAPTPPGQDEPIPHLPNPQPPYTQDPGPVTPPPSYLPADLHGQCEDVNHGQFYAAKNFANLVKGLNLTPEAATQWALDYNKNHACSTINEFTSRFYAIRDFALSANGLALAAADAQAYALTKAEVNELSRARNLPNMYFYLKSFAVSNVGLQLSSSDGAAFARQWIDAGAWCAALDEFKNIAARYRSEFNFANDSKGLNYDNAHAKAYAIEKVQPLSGTCASLFH